MSETHSECQHAIDKRPVFTSLATLAFGVLFLAALTVYILTLAPTITLENSGERTVAAVYLGVPHNPGDPI